MSIMIFDNLQLKLQVIFLYKTNYQSIILQN